jgi:hypothetical protein
MCEANENVRGRHVWSVRLTMPVAFLLLGSIASWARANDSESLFELKIRPVLAGTCSKCHGGKKTSHGLRVDSREALLKGGETGPAIVPGEPDRSLLIQALRYSHPEFKMPPDRRLSNEVVADFAAWIKQGAVWVKNSPTQPITEHGFSKHARNQHWAFQPIRKIIPPADPSGWSANAVDRFILAGLGAHHLKPVAPADRRTLLRRLYFDLIGLPPSPEETAGFLADNSPDAWAKTVERLLASVHYGERWGRHWMDVVRYADTAGDNADYPVPEARLYRDYIIDSFNADKPYDRFVQEQIAGDILAKEGPRQKYAERVVATGFLALSRRYATAPYELWYLTMEDTIETTGRAFLGLTLRCARCHDHKFDPITQEDYYALYGIFASTRYPWAGGEEFASMKKPRQQFVPLSPADQSAPHVAAYRKKIHDLETEIQQCEKKIKSRGTRSNEKKEPSGRDITCAAEQKLLNETVHNLRGQLQDLLKSDLPRDLPAAYAVQEGKPVDMYVHLRGDENQHGPTVKRDVPRFLAGDRSLSIPEGTSGRLQLAQWLTRPENPLTARVMVNRIWQHHFGKGIVATPSNLGTRGEPPSHPELLDWLASRFIESGWSIKAMHREILLSKTYQLSSAYDERNAASDPGNRWYWRRDRRRLDAEALRDALLLVSDGLNKQRPGPHPFPPIERWGWTQHSPFKDVYSSNHRSVYLMTQRFQRHPYLAIFDGPDTNTSTEQRSTSTVPQQALFLMNNPFVTQQAEQFARRLIGSSSDWSERIELAHQLAWCRPSTPQEQEGGRRYVQKYTEELAKAGASSERLELEAWTSYARILLSANEFLYLD